MQTSLFNSIPKELPAELVETILSAEAVKIERIVSRGHASKEAFWYDQDKNEFVLVLQGSAGVMFQGDETSIALKPGDYLIIEAHVQHRVVWTDPDTDTIWLAVHY